VFDSVVGPENISMFTRLDGTIYVGIQKPSSSCIYLELYISTSEENKNDIHVHTLDNCEEEKKGSELLMLVEELAQRIGSKKVTLLDASRIKWGSQSVSLKTLYNLTTGQSWYNSLGYICLNNPYGSYAENYEFNKRKIKTTKVSDFIEEVKDNTHDRLTEEMIDNLFREITETHHELNPEMNIQDYFTIVRKILRERSSPVVVLLIKLLFNIEVSDVISTSLSDCLLVKEMDTSPLIKDIKRQPTVSGGKKQKKCNKTKRKMRRYKKSRKRIK
jgi:hypothetical protein